MLWSYDLLILTWPRLLHQPLIINDGTIGLHYVMKTRPSRWSVQRIHEQIFWEYGPRFWKLSLSVSLQPPSVRSVPQERACRTCSIAALWPSRLTSGRFRSYLPRVSLTPINTPPEQARSSAKVSGTGIAIASTLDSSTINEDLGIIFLLGDWVCHVYSLQVNFANKPTNKQK